MNSTSFVERILAHGLSHPDHVAVKDVRREYTALDLRRLVVRLARAMDSVGLSRGDRVAIVPALQTEALAVRYAAGLLGCPTAFCPNTGVAGRLARFVTRAHADVVVVFPETAATVTEIAASPAAPRIMSVGDVPGAFDLGRVDPGAPATLPATPVDPDAPAVLVASGGTTGESKLSRRSYADWEHVIDVGALEDRRLLLCTSFAYVAQVLADQVLLGGGTLMLRPRFDAVDVLRTIAAERITHLALVEPLLVELVDHPEVHRHDLSSLVAISHIGADAAPSLRRRLLRRAGPVLAHCYGASEAGIVSVLSGSDYSLEAPERLGTAGTPLPGVDVRIEGPDGSELSRGEEGLISVRSPQLANGYDGDGPIGGFAGDRYRTGDLGRLDLDGYLYVRGRAADRRVIAGIPVMPVDVQEAFCEHPAVRYAVVVPDGDGFAALVVLVPGTVTRVAALADEVARRHGEHLLPRTLAVVERIPVTEQGKPDRARITALLDETTAPR